MAENLQCAREIVVQCFFEFFAPPGRIRWQSTRCESRRREIKPRVQSAPAIKSQLLVVEFVKIMKDSANAEAFVDIAANSTAATVAVSPRRWRTKSRPSPFAERCSSSHQNTTRRPLVRSCPSRSCERNSSAGFHSAPSLPPREGRPKATSTSPRLRSQTPNRTRSSHRHFVPVAVATGSPLALDMGDTPVSAPLVQTLRRFPLPAMAASGKASTAAGQTDSRLPTPKLQSPSPPSCSTAPGPHTLSANRPVPPPEYLLPCCARRSRFREIARSWR